MFYHISALALISMVLVLAAVRRSSLYSPLVISAWVWLVVFIAGVIFQERFYPIKESAFIAWLIWFMVTSLIFFLLCPSSAKRAWTETEIRRIPVDYTLPLLVLTFLLCYSIWVVGSTGPEHFFLNLRMVATDKIEGTATLGLLKRIYPLILALFLFEHVYERRENRHLRFLLWCLMLLYAMVMMSKLSILIPAVSWAIIRGIKGELKISRIVVLSTVVFASMISLHFARAAVSDASTIIDILAGYIYSPIVALGYMNVDKSLPFGAYVFRFFYAVANHLGIIAAQPVKVVTPWVEIPEPTNAYTVMQPFYHDFGLFGVLFGAVLYGLFFSCLYWLSVKGSRFGLVLFSGYSIVLVAQFITDQLIMIFSGNLQFLIYIFVVFLASKRVNHVY